MFDPVSFSCSALALECCGLISAETNAAAVTSAFPVPEFFLLALALLQDANAKKPALLVVEGIFNVTLVVVCATISSMETAEDVSA